MLVKQNPKKARLHWGIAVEITQINSENDDFHKWIQGFPPLFWEQLHASCENAALVCSRSQRPTLCTPSRDLSPHFFTVMALSQQEKNVRLEVGLIHGHISWGHLG